MLGFLAIIIVAVFVVVYATLGFRRGMLRSVSAIVVLYAAYMAAKFGTPMVFPFVVGVIPFFGAYMYIAIFALIMYGTYFVLSVVTRSIIKGMLHLTRPSMLSRMIGGVAGGFFGVFIASILFYLAKIFVPVGMPVVSAVLMQPVASTLISIVSNIL